ncbi:acyl-CoA dehydrogenase family protein [Glaciimonas sp. CA11.2]|uniref:acyl-CoA dehydrogenase family protein n=1 Tax=Glaciimonas sp. CA11.2 TaxID=3048601 RepID=UPI002AB34DC3|nr:acyl-CoA dehydrogenase family protein [Glaciimonas sp. CA11.2]MDY7547102.1 acyl-CoA dehydrogenase family protein [Glaciimonas sp. CA11.2]MEB0161995.1 acyl-CoA dehydrogenase family protein [Glaciimonas sp. CA11.2]
MNTISSMSGAGISLEPSEFERMIGETVQRLFSDHIDAALLRSTENGQWPAELWQLLEDTGLPLSLCSAQAGGSEAQWSDVYAVLAAIGRWSMPLPLAETMIATSLLSRAGKSVPQGPITIAETGRVVLAAEAELKVSGVLHGVAWARSCAYALVPIGDASGAHQLALINLGGAGVLVVQGTNMAGEPRDVLQLDAVTVETLFDNPLPALEQPLFVLGAMARSAMLVGALERALELTVQYTNDRVQFGKPLSKNQVIQHGLAVTASEMVAAKVATRVAFASLNTAQQARTTTFDVAVAKVRVGQAASRLADVAHQFHGAIGFTQEHSLHHTTLRLWSWRQEFGSDATWARALGRAAITQGAAAFWPSLTERSMAPALQG